MTEEDPLSIVQVRYARGEIETAEYEEFLSWFLKNISFQQVPSLKIASERYANGEISIGQYKEILSHLLNDISNYQQSAPLRTVHLRYAEGEIETTEFEEKIGVLMKDIPAYPHSPPLAVLFNRYAKGEIDNLRYKEMLGHLATYCTPTLPKEGSAAAPLEPEKNQPSAPKTQTVSPSQKTTGSQPPSKPSEPPASPDPYRLNFAAMQNPSSPGMVTSQTSVAGEIQGGLQPTGELQGLGSTPDVMADQQVIIQAASDLTAKSGSYHITDISASPAPVTVLVKPEIDTGRKDTTVSIKQNNQEVTPEAISENIQKEEPVSPDSIEQTVQEAAVADADKVIPEVSGSSSGDHQKIKALIKQGKYQESITRLDEMLKQTPDDYRSLFLKSIALFNLGKGDDALDILSKAKESCTNKEDAKEIERIYDHIVQKGNGKGQKRDKGKETEGDKNTIKDVSKMPSLSSHPELAQFEHADTIEKICEKAQGMIDSGDYKGANETLADLSNLVKDIPIEIMKKESIDDLFAAKGFVLYQLKEFCEAKKFFKEATRINPKNETAIHYLNDIRVRDCNKFVRHV